MFLEFYTIIITGIYQVIYQVLLCDMSYTIITEIPTSMEISLTLLYQTVCQNYICINNSFTILYFLPLCQAFYEIIPAFPSVLEFYLISLSKCSFIFPYVCTTSCAFDMFKFKLLILMWEWSNKNSWGYDLKDNSQTRSKRSWDNNSGHTKMSMLLRHVFLVLWTYYGADRCYDKFV